jgi:hypothetical protein
VIRTTPTARRLDAFDWMGLIKPIDPEDLNVDERHLYNALARQRLEIWRRELDLAELDLHPLIRSATLAKTESLVAE